MISNRLVKAVFDATTADIMWAMEAEARESNESIDERFSYKEIVRQYNNLIDEHKLEVIGNAQAIMFLCGRIAGMGEDYLYSVKTIKKK
jgi:hypothetical protein